MKEVLRSMGIVIMEQAGFEQTFSDMWWRKLKSGTGVLGVFWNPSKNNGLGDIDIRQIDILNLFWEPGVTDIQQTSLLSDTFHILVNENVFLIAVFSAR